MDPTTPVVYTFTAPPNPGLTPPPGIIPNFQDPFSLQPYTAVDIALCIILGTLLVAARMFTKIWVVKKFLWEDYTCIVGWVCSFFDFLASRYRRHSCGKSVQYNMLTVMFQVTFVIFLGIEWATGAHGGGTHQ